MKRAVNGLLCSVLLAVSVLGGRIALGWLLRPAPSVPTSEEVLRVRALALHRDAIVVDGHNDVLTWVVDYGYDLGMDGDEPDDRSPCLYAGLHNGCMEFDRYEVAHDGDTVHAAIVNLGW